MKNTPANSPLRNWKLVSGATLLGLCLTAVGCGTAGLPPGQTQKGDPVPTGPFVLTVNSLDTPDPIDVTDATGAKVGSITGTSSFTLNYAAGTKVNLSAPNFSGLEIFSKWTGCEASVGPTCFLTMTSDTKVTAVYVPQVSFTLQPQVAGAGPNGGAPYYLLVGTGEQIYLHPTFLNNLSNGNVTWSVVSSDPAFSPGFIDQGGNYVSPYPAPPFVTITIVSQFDPISTVSVVINLGEPGAVAGPDLTVDTSAVTHPISPLIYGINQFDSGTALQSVLPVPLDRWGGDAATRYNYLLDLTNSAADYYFETNPNSNTAFPDTSQVNTQIAQDKQYGAASMITVPLIGYTTQSPDSTKRAFACGYSASKYNKTWVVDPNQQNPPPPVDQYHPDCGTGKYKDSNGNTVQFTANDPADTSVAIDQTFDAGWVNYLSTKFGTAAKGGVQIYELDNEPEYWLGVHTDVHPNPLSYDELTNKGIAYATAIKTADPTAAVSGPVISSFNNYFYSPLDGTNSNADYKAHNSTFLLAYYLQQMSAASTTAGTRLLDYLDLHGYYAEGGAAFAPAGTTATQMARERSVRNLYDSTYTGYGEKDPSGSGNLYPVQLIPFMQKLAADNYPGTKTAITEYNFGGLESISGAIAQAETLAIFGSQGLDMAALWSPPDPTTQFPGVVAFDFFLNYDGAGSKFGDGSLNTTSADSSQVTVYAAKRSSDGKTTVIVFNKTYQDETSTIKLTTTATSAKVFQYSAADLTKITAGSAATVTSGAVTVTYPAQSITLLEF